MIILEKKNFSILQINTKFENYRNYNSFYDKTTYNFKEKTKIFVVFLNNFATFPYAIMVTIIDIVSWTKHTDHKKNYLT